MSVQSRFRNYALDDRVSAEGNHQRRSPSGGLVPHNRLKDARQVRRRIFVASFLIDAIEVPVRYCFKFGSRCIQKE
jgi:hypothetical protein